MFGFFSGFSGVKLVMTQEQHHHSSPPAHHKFSRLKVVAKIRHRYPSTDNDTSRKTG